MWGLRREEWILFRRLLHLLNVSDRASILFKHLHLLNLFLLDWEFCSVFTLRSHLFFVPEGTLLESLAVACCILLRPDDIIQRKALRWMLDCFLERFHEILLDRTFCRVGLGQLTSNGFVCPQWLAFQLVHIKRFLKSSLFLLEQCRIELWSANLVRL